MSDRLAPAGRTHKLAPLKGFGAAARTRGGDLAHERRGLHQTVICVRLRFVERSRVRPTRASIIGSTLTR
jgi:hypothetical protein